MTSISEKKVIEIKLPPYSQGGNGACIYRVEGKDYLWVDKRLLSTSIIEKEEQKDGTEKLITGNTIYIVPGGLTVYKISKEQLIEERNTIYKIITGSQ